MYECDTGMEFDNWKDCEEYATEIAESKGLSAYCIGSDELDDPVGV